MKYISTRDTSISFTGAEAMKQGLSKEGGLFVPESIVPFEKGELFALAGKPYREAAYAVMKKYLTDFTKEELFDCIDSAYSEKRWEEKEITPLVGLSDSAYILELFHGPTCAFKDVALQILPKFLTYSIKKTGEDKTVVILVATSGDTGKAALEGFADVEGTRIAVFYPDDGVSDMQKLQMVTQSGGNVNVGAVIGNFDDAQNGVKKIFTDKAFAERIAERGFMLSSANSINWGRLLPQIVYYVYAYARLISMGRIKEGEGINICVPTGNFGNILAAYYAMKMGVPVKRLICASNENNVLTDFINTGIYDKNRTFHTTISPSMDILISSNLERLLFDISGGDEKLISSYMKALSESGRYEVTDGMKKKISEIFCAGFTDDAGTKATINRVFSEKGYLCDTHTGVAVTVYEEYVKKTGDTTPAVIASTASPYKFAKSVLEALKVDISGKNDFELLDELSKKSGVRVPDALGLLKTKPVRFTAKIKKEDMESFVDGYLK
ncbi:MAG: threonine synthase [Clostridia bacterium]|nr:threonine synthase [Clostridia bacterium]